MFRTKRVINLAGLGIAKRFRLFRVKNIATWWRRGGWSYINLASIGLEVGDELQLVGWFSRQAAGLDLNVPHHAGLQFARIIGGVALQPGTVGGGQVIVGIPLEHACPGIGGLTVAVLEYKEAAARDRQIQPSTGTGHVTIAVEILGNVVHLYTTSLATAINGGKLGTAGLEAGRAGVGHVVADDTQFLVYSAQAAQSDTERHSFAPI